MNLMIDPRVFISHKIGGSRWSYTVTTRLGQMLSQAESEFGERDGSFTLLGVEFGGEIPCIWFPGCKKNISVRLNISALGSEAQACFQLAHEVIHLLSPVTGGTNVLEEGLATYFSVLWVKRNLSVDMSPEPSSYANAMNLVVDLIGCNHMAIKNIRKTEPSFLKIGPEMLLSECPHLGPEKAEMLVQMFER